MFGIKMIDTKQSVYGPADYENLCFLHIRIEIIHEGYAVLICIFYQSVKNNRI